MRPADEVEASSLWRRIANPLAWSPADRCLLATVIMLAGVALFVGAVWFSAGWPYLRADADPAATRLLGRLSLLVVALWAVIFGAALVARRRAPGSRLLIHATVQAYAITIGLFTCVTGPFYSPGWIAFLGGALVGFLMFGVAATTAGVVTFLAIVATGAWVLQVNAIPAVTALAGLSAFDQSAASWIRMGACSVAYAVFTLALTSQIITRWREREAHFELLSRTDVLTGLTNRRRFLELLEREFQRAARYGTPLSCVLVDLDHFKRVNDTHGHLAGDQVLAAVARTLAGGVRDVDLVARYGGEEFALLLPETPAAGAEEVAARCLRLLRDTPIVTSQTRLVVTASMGIASYPHPAMKRVEDLVRVADEALYRAKEQGRNRVVVAGTAAA